MTSFRTHSLQETEDRENRPDRLTTLDCLDCEALVTDMLDEQLTPAERAAFDRHVQSCQSCTESFGQAQRGVALLAMLKNPRPQPRPELLEAILAQTIGNEALQVQTEHSSFAGLGPDIAAAARSPAFDKGPNRPGLHTGRLLPFRPRPSVPGRLGQILLEPRLAMTAAMAFFSITLTMSLTGVRLNDLNLSSLSLSDLSLSSWRPSSLSPSGARRLAHTAEAGAVRYYDNLRVVHVLESRVENLRETLQGNHDGGSAPASSDPVSPDPARRRPEVRGRHRATAPDAGTSQLAPQRLSPSSHPSAPPANAALAVSPKLSDPNGDRS